MSSGTITVALARSGASVKNTLLMFGEFGSISSSNSTVTFSFIRSRSNLIILGDDISGLYCIVLVAISGVTSTTKLSL